MVVDMNSANLTYFAPIIPTVVGQDISSSWREFLFRYLPAGVRAAGIGVCRSCNADLIPHAGAPGKSYSTVMLCFTSGRVP